MLVLWAAHVYAHALAESLERRRRLDAAELGSVARRELSIPAAAVAPVAALVLAALGVLGTQAAVWLALGVGVVTLGVQGARYATVEQLDRAGTLAAIALNLFLGLASSDSRRYSRTSFAFSAASIIARYFLLVQPAKALQRCEPFLLRGASTSPSHALRRDPPRSGGGGSGTSRAVWRRSTSTPRARRSAAASISCHRVVWTVGLHQSSSRKRPPATPKAISARARYGASPLRAETPLAEVPASQSATSRMTPRPTNVKPPSRSCEVRMSQASWAAGCTAVDGTRLLHDERSAQSADDQHEQPGQDRPERDHPQDRASPAAGDPQRDPPEGNGQEPEPRAEELQHLRQVLGSLELLGLHDLDAASVGTELLRDVADDRHPLPQLDHERLEVEDHGAVFGAQRADVVVEDVDQLPVRPRDGVHPERLHAGTLEHTCGGPVGELAQTRRRGARQPLLIRRQPLL